MTGVIEFLATIILLILIVIAVSQLLNGTFIEWARSKFVAGEAQA